MSGGSREKVFFGYVLLSGLLLYLFLYKWQKKSDFKKTFLVFLFSLIFCLPYLSYTYFLTGKIFYWGNSGGIGLYAMSSPYEDELGGLKIRNLKESKNHQEFLKKLAKKTYHQLNVTRRLKKNCP